MAVFVPDASATLAWFFEDETSASTDALLTRLESGDTAVVPQHWPLEVANALLMAMPRGRISKDKISRLFGDLLALPIRIDPATSDTTFNQIFACAENYRLTVYDAAYLELAMRERIPLATLDNDLRNAARAAGVPLVHES
jgi:predicted nucleic acid-binding protein